MTSWTDYQDDISDAISESMDVDWSASVGARAVVAWLNEHKPLMADTPRVTVPVEPTEAMIEAGNRALSPWIAPAMHAAEAYRAMLSAAPAPEGGAVDWDAKDQELIERGLRTIRTHDAVRYLREALTATTVRLTGYDWNADPDGVTKQQGDAFAAADRVFADLDAAVASHPEIELPECQTCGGTGKIEEAARMEGANKHSACIRTCDDCDGCGFAPDDEPAALATREEAPDWIARTESAWAENNREEAPAEAGEDAELIARLEEMADFFDGATDPVIAETVCDEHARDIRSALRALRVQPPAREGEGQ